MRRLEARVLLDAGLPAGAYYLLGYSVECAIKACIAKATNRHEFPDFRRVRKSYSHNLEQLIGVAGLQRDLETATRSNRALAINWAVVKDWSEHRRYEASISMQLARDLYSACTSRVNGVLPWLRQRW